MEMLKIPGTDILISRVGLGCMNFGGHWDKSREPFAGRLEEAAADVMKTALDCGINFFDHADIYCGGASEEIFAANVKKLGLRRDDLVIQSKFGIRWGDGEGAPNYIDSSADWLRASVEGILSRLQTDYLDSLLLHWPDPLLDPEPLDEALRQLTAEGRLRSFGVSNWGAPMLRLWEKKAQTPIRCNQVQLNPLHSWLLDETYSFNRERPGLGSLSQGTLPHCHAEDILLQAWAPLAGGSLGGDYDEAAEPRTQAAWRAVDYVAKAFGAPKEAILTAWLAHIPATVVPLIGTRNPERIRASCRYAEFELSRQDWLRIYAAGAGGKAI